MVERDGQLAVLHDLLAESVAGRGRSALVTGRVGSGKPALRQDFGERIVATGAVFLDACASRAERAAPYGVLRQLFPAAGPPRGDPAEILDERCTALLRLAERAPGGLVLGIDDVHHADPASLECLLFFIRRFRRAKILVVLNESAPPRVAPFAFHAELPPEPYLRRIRLGPCPPDRVPARP